MIRRLNRLLAIIAIAAAVAYLLTVNPQPATLTLWGSHVYRASMGVIALAIFGSGVILASLVGGALGIRAYFRERALRTKLSQRETLNAMMVRARSYIVTREFPRARSLLASILKRDAGNLIARLELARCLELEGEIATALSLLDEARVSDGGSNVEVLLRSAELQRALGNRTAALELVVRAQGREGSRYLLERAREIARESGDLESAIRFHREWVDLSAESEDSRRITGELEFGRLMREWERQKPPSGAPGESWRDTLRVFLKRFPDCVPALVESSRQDLNHGDTPAAVAHLTLAAQISGEPRYWHDAMTLWIRGGQPERAVAVARTATKESTGVARIHAELELARVLLSLSMTDDAEHTLSELNELVTREGVSWTPALIVQTLLLRSLLYLHRRQIGEVQRILDELLSYELIPGPQGLGELSGGPRTENSSPPTLLLEGPAKGLPSPQGVAPALSTP